MREINHGRDEGGRSPEHPDGMPTIFLRDRNHDAMHTVGRKPMKLPKYGEEINSYGCASDVFMLRAPFNAQTDFSMRRSRIVHPDSAQWHLAHAAGYWANGMAQSGPNSIQAMMSANDPLRT